MPFPNAFRIADAVAMPFEMSQLFDDPSVTDVAFNGFDRLAFKRQGLWLSGSSPFDSELEFSQWLVDAVESADGRLDFSHPASSVSFDGFRLHALIGGQITERPSATIRRLRPTDGALRFADQESHQRLSVLRAAVADRKNMLIAGPAGSGKTSLLRELLRSVGSERVVTIEDVAELALEGDNCVALVSRDANVEGVGEIGLQDLVVEALRMSPDRLVVGEIRGKELLVILNALNTGHAGAGATIHANSMQSVAGRLSAIAASSGVSQTALARMVVDAIDLVVFIDRLEGHRIRSIGHFKLEGKSLVIEPSHE